MYYMNKVTRFLYRITPDNRVERYCEKRKQWVDSYTIFPHEIMAHVATGYFLEINENEVGV